MLIGRRNQLKVLEVSVSGVYLDAGEGEEICLPTREATVNCQVGSMLDVFVYRNSEDLLIATLEKPFAMVDEFASLQVTAIQEVGAFLNWGLPKELFLPFREQTRHLEVGDLVSVFLYLDKSHRISASMRIEKYIDRTPGNYQEGEGVQLFIASETDLGFKAIINGRHLGVLYRNEIFQSLRVGQWCPGYIKKIREDGKIDLSLQQEGNKDSGEIGRKILILLEMRGGFLPVGDKASAEVIYDLFGISKKKYKMAIGSLYKKQLITIDDDGIRLKVGG